MVTLDLDFHFPPDPDLDCEENGCGAQHPGIGWCTRETNHDGMHVACTESYLLGVWDDSMAINISEGLWL